MKTFACRDLGINCDFVATGKTDEEVAAKAKKHGKTVTGQTEADMTPELEEKIKSLTKNS